MGSNTDSDDPRCGIRGPRMGQVESWASDLRRAVKTAHVPLPLANAWLVTLLEIFGGLALLVGAFVAIVSVPLILSMLGAMFTVNIKFGFSAVNTIGLTPAGPQLGPPGYEINLLYIACLVVLILGGAGPLSIDALRSRRRQRHLRVAERVRVPGAA